ncbi:hypothetical protein FNV43_RR03585 [Rhamnella rubrinervis]|uniref:Uncharacterized protein n=1 Tax=Rhamnella rubrinervis TaxID=2594499 RepID=A0A8K0HK59_9ROSA|nr:hypothetical protein FNV43_RR03585 [Rhamnella rubrinervis]
MLAKITHQHLARLGIDNIEESEASSFQSEGRESKLEIFGKPKIKIEDQTSTNSGDVIRDPLVLLNTASNSKSIQLRHFLGGCDSKLIHNGNGKLSGGSRCRPFGSQIPRVGYG